MKLALPTVNISTRFAAVASTLVVISALTIGAILFSANAQILIADAEAELAFDMKQAGTDLQESANSARTKVAFLAELPQVMELADAAGTPERVTELKQQLERIFVSLASTSEDVMQVRMIGAADSGRELVRVDRKGSLVSEIDQAELQQKGSRPYVKNTLAAAPGTILLSDIELNREQGRIQVPHVPVMRASTPIYTSTGRIFGLLVININMNEVMNRMRSRFPADVNVYLINANGDYISHPNPDKTFGFEFGRPAKFVDDFPELKSFVAGHETDETVMKPVGGLGENIVQLSRKTINAPHTPLSFVAAAMLPKTSALVADYDRQIQIGILTFIMACIGAVVAIVTSRWLVKPLRNLTKAAARLAEGGDIGKLDIAAHRKDEVGVLARSFTMMAKKLKERQIGLEEKQERIRAILDAASTPIITIDREGVIQNMNAATPKLFGFRRSELIGANIALLVNRKDAVRLHRHLIRIRKSGRVRTLDSGSEIEARAKNGEAIPVHLSVSPVRLSNRLLYTAVMTDLREQKKINRLKDEFVSTVSHELRTPLTSIKGSLALLKSNVFGEFPERTAQMIDIAHTNADRLANLVNDILDIEKIKSGKLTFHIETLELGAFLNRVIEANSGLAQSLGVSLKLDQCPGDLMLDADPDRLAQVVTNLISNALKFTPKGGEVTVSALAEEHSMRIAIADQGQGVPAEFHDKIFTKFAQADSSSTRASGGTGLGLAISKAIVDAHGGEIGFESATGTGSVFYIDLPRRQPMDRHLDGDGTAEVVGAA